MLAWETKNFQKFFLIIPHRQSFRQKITKQNVLVIILHTQGRKGLIPKDCELTSKDRELWIRKWEIQVSYLWIIKEFGFKRWIRRDESEEMSQKRWARRDEPEDMSQKRWARRDEPEEMSQKRWARRDEPEEMSQKRWARRDEPEGMS